jgi:hypothetical protein
MDARQGDNSKLPQMLSLGSGDIGEYNITLQSMQVTFIQAETKAERGLYTNGLGWCRNSFQDGRRILQETTQSMRIA